MNLLFHLFLYLPTDKDMPINIISTFKRKGFFFFCQEVIFIFIVEFTDINEKYITLLTKNPLTLTK